MGRVLVACEESQAVTLELRALGVEAYSCDMEPCSGGYPKFHIQGNVIPLLDECWDMIIAFPPCTHLASSGARWFKEKQEDGRQQSGIDFFMLFANAKCQKIAIENPVGIMSTKYRKPDQIIQPWQFGYSTTKATCLWLKGLPLLKPTNIVNKGDRKQYASGRNSPLWHAKTGKGCGKERSKTYKGIARAMAGQWTPTLIE